MPLRAFRACTATIATPLHLAGSRQRRSLLAGRSRRSINAVPLDRRPGFETPGEQTNSRARDCDGPAFAQPRPAPGDVRWHTPERLTDVCSLLSPRGDSVCLARSLIPGRSRRALASPMDGYFFNRHDQTRRAVQATPVSPTIDILRPITQT